LGSYCVQVIKVLLHYFAFKYRGKKDQKRFILQTNKLEAIWSVILLFNWFDSLWTFATNIMFVDEDEDTIVIELYAQQFNWKARYSGNECL
jgi:cytochrome c oxidase subunit 2